MIEHLEDDQLWRIACDTENCDAEDFDPRHPAGVKDDAVQFMRRAALFWRWRAMREGKAFRHLCAACANAMDRKRRRDKFLAYYNGPGTDKRDRQRSACHERKRLGLS